MQAAYLGYATFLVETRAMSLLMDPHTDQIWSPLVVPTHVLPLTRMRLCAASGWEL